MAIERVRSKILKFYVPLILYLAFLLFPFYWMVNTTFKSDNELYDMSLNPFVIHSPTLDNIVRLFTETIFLKWMANTFFVALTATAISLVASLLAAYAIQRLKFKTSGPTGVAIFLSYLVPQTILFIPLAHIIFKLKLADIIINVTAGGPGGATDSVTSFIFREYRDRSNVGYGTLLAMVYLVLIVIAMTVLIKAADRWMRPRY